jgi:hypothetical protein
MPSMGKVGRLMTLLYAPFPKNTTIDWFILGLFHDPFIRVADNVSNGRMILDDKLEGKHKETVMT